MEQQPANNSLEDEYSGSPYDSSLEAETTQTISGTSGSSLGHPKFSPFRFNKLAITITAASLIFIGLVGVATVVLAGLHHGNNQDNQTAADKVNNYNVSSLSLQSVKGNQALTVGETDHLAVNGQLRVSDTVVLSPGDQPTAPELGQIYFDKTNNAPYYFDGTAFVSLAPEAIPQSVTSLGGAAGDIALGDGLEVNGDTLAVSSDLLQTAASLNTPRVTSLQGLSGDVTLVGGTGISISGTTITNSGVVSLTSSDHSITITPGANGQYDLSAVSGPGSTAVVLGPNASQTDSTTNASININKTGASGNLLQLAVNGVNKFVVDQTGTITSGFINFSQVQGVPPIVNTFQGASGNVTLTAGSGIGIVGTTISNTGVVNVGGTTGAIALGTGLGVSAGTLSNTGVTSLTGTANQVSVSAATGSVTLTLPQNIGTGSSPIFGGEIINGALTVNGGGASIGGGLNVTGATGLSGNLTVSGGTTLNGSLSVTGANSLTTGTGTVTFGSLGAGLVQSSAGGVLSSGAVDRNSATFFTATTLSVANGGTGSGTAAGARANLGAAASGANSDITSLSGLTTALSVGQGGTGDQTLTADGILFGNGSGAVQATAAAANSILATNGSSIPSLVQTLPLAVQGNITATGALGSGSIASGFGTISTGNNITTTAALQGGTLSVAAGTFTVDASGNIVTTGTAAVQGVGGLTLGVASTTNGKLVFASSSNAHLTTLQGLAPAGQNQTITLPATNAVGGTDTICLQSLANCAGSGSSVTASGYTQNYLTKFDGTTNEITTSQVFDNGTSIGVGTNTPSASYKLDVNGSVQTNGNFNQSGVGSFTTGSGAVTLNGSVSIPGTSTFTLGSGAATLGGTLGVTGLSTLSGGASIAGLTVTAGATINGNSNIATTSGNTSIGTAGATFSLLSSGLSVTTAGALSGITTLTASGAITAATSGNTINGLVVNSGALSSVTGINTSGGYIQSGSTANTLTGATTIQNTLDVQGATAKIGVAGTTTGSLILANSGNATQRALLQAQSVSGGSGDATFQLPSAAGGSTYTVCVSGINCGAAANTITGSSAGTTNFIPKYTGNYSLANSSISDDGTTVSISETLSAATISTTTIQSAGAMSITPGGSLTVGATSQLLTLQGNASTTLVVGSGGNSTTVGFVAPSGNHTINFPAQTGTVCLEGDTVGCGFAAGGSGVTSITGTAGGSVTATGGITINNSLTTASAITINDASTIAKGIAEFNSSDFSVSSGIVDTIQPITTSSAVTFGSLTVGSGGNVTLSATGKVITNEVDNIAGVAMITLNAGGGGTNIQFANQGGANTFLFPTTGGTGQVICTSGITCASGGGQAVILEPSAVQTANANKTALFINKQSGSGDLVDLQAGGADAFVIDNTGANHLYNTTTIDTLATNTITPTAALTVGATNQTFTIQGDFSSGLHVNDGTNDSFLGFAIKSGFSAQTGSIYYAFEADNNVSPNTLGTPYFICTTAGNCAGVGGGVTTDGSATVGSIPIFTSTNNIESSLLTQASNTITLSGNLDVGTSTNGALLIGAAGSTNASLGFKYNNGTVDKTITVQGPSTLSSLTANVTLNLPTSNGTFAVAATGPLSLDATTGVLSCATCLTGGGGGSGGVTGITGTHAGSVAISGSLTINNALTSGSAITLDNAKADASTKGIATFNATNFQDNGSGTINTIQDIATTASPTFANLIVNGATGLTLGDHSTNAGHLVFEDGTADSGNNYKSTFTQTTLTGNRSVTVPDAGGTLAVSASGNLSLSALGNLTISNSPSFTTSVTTPQLSGSGGLTITPNGSLTAGSTTNQFTLQGTAASTITATSGSFTTTVGFTTPTANRSINFPDAGGTICTDSGNCLGASGGANAHLSNLSSVAINTTLLPGVAAAVDLGSGSLPFGQLYIAGTSGTPATNNFKLTGASTHGTDVITIPDVASDTLCVQTANNCSFEKTNGTDFIKNSSGGPQTANFNIAAASGIAASIQGASGQDIIDFYSSTPTKVAFIDSTGALTAAAVTSNGALTASGTVTFSGLSSGLVQSASGVLSAGTIDRNSGSFFNSTVLTVANGGTGTNTLTSKGILFGNGTGIIQATAAAANSVLVTDGSSNPSLSQTLPAAVQGNIVATGALASGSIASGFGTINTASNITTSTQLQGGTLKAGSSTQFQVDASGNVSTSGTISTTNSSGLAVGVANTTAGQIVLHTTGAGDVTINSVAQAGALAVSFPADTHGTDTFCLATLGNCSASAASVILNQTAQQVGANFNIQATAHSVAAVIQGDTFANDILDLYAGGAGIVAKVDSAGNLTAVGGTFSGNLTGGTYNGQTISSTANFTGSATIATFLGINNTALANRLAINTVNPDALAQAIIGTGAATNKGLVIQASASQTADLLEFQASSTGVMAAFDANGELAVGTGSFSGAVTGASNNRPGVYAMRTGAGTILAAESSVSGIVFSADDNGVNVAGSAGAGRLNVYANSSSHVGVMISASSGQTADLLQVTNSVGQPLTAFDATGKLVFYNAGTLDSPSTNLYRSAASTLKTDGGLVVGTLGSGTGTSVLCVDGSNKLATCSSSAGSGSFILNGTSLQTSANFNIQSAASTSVGGIIRGATSQTADLQEFQDSNGNVLTKFDANGNLTSYGTNETLNNLAVPTGVTASTSPATNFYYEVTAVNVQGETTASSEVHGSAAATTVSWTAVPGATSYRVYRGTSSGAEVGYIPVTAPTVSVANAQSASLTGASTPPVSTTGTKLTLQGWSGQTGKVLDVQNSAGTSVFSVFPTVGGAGPTAVVTGPGGGALTNATLYVDNTSNGVALGVTGDASITGTVSAPQGQFNAANGSIVLSAINSGNGGGTALSVQTSTIGGGTLIGGTSTGGANIFTVLDNGHATLGNVAASNAVQGTLTFSDGTTSNKGLTLQVADGSTSLSNNITVRFPANDTNATDTVCLLTLGNCFGAGTGGVTASGATSGQVAYFNGSTTLTSSSELTETSSHIGINTGSYGTVAQLTVNANNTVDNAATVQINSSAIGNKGLVVQGFSGQTANLLELQSSGGGVVSSFDSQGHLSINGAGGSTSAIELGLINNGANGIDFTLGAPSGNGINSVWAGGGAQAGNYLNFQQNSSVTATQSSSAVFINLSRNETVSSGFTYTHNSDDLDISSQCGGLGTCVDGSHLISLNQQFTGSTGSVLNVLGAGTGNLAVLDASNASGNGVSIDVQSSSSSQYALKVTSNNGSTNDLYVEADGKVGINLSSGFGTAARLTVNANNTVDNAATVQINSSAIGNKGLVVQGFSGQTANLLEVQDSSGNINAAFNSTGNQLTLGRAAASGTVTQGKLVLSDGTTSNKTLTLQVGDGLTALSNTTTIKFPTTASASDTLCLQTLGNCFGSGGASGVTDTGYSNNFVTKFDATTDQITASQLFDNGTFVGLNTVSNNGQLSVVAGSAQPTLYAQGFTSGSSAIGVIKNNGSTGDYLDLNSTSTTVAKFDNSGNLTFGQASTVSTSTGALTIQGNSGLNLNVASGTIAVGNSSTSGTTFQANSASDAATVGSEINTTGTFSNPGGCWNAPTGTGTSASISTNASCGTTVNFTLPSTLVNGNYYQFSYTISGYSGSGNIHASLASHTGASQSGNITSYTEIFQSSFTSSNIAFLPSSFTGTITSISVKQLTPATASLSVESSSGSTALEVRTGGPATNQNTFIGLQAGQANSTGTFDTALGKAALQSNATGAGNTAVGALALQANTTGSNNTALGDQALQLNVNGANNTAIGVFALQNNTAGSYNIAIGLQSLVGNVTGTNNLGIGFNALAANLSGSGNTALGYTALAASTGDNNTGVGNNALGTNTTGTKNTGLGFNAGSVDNNAKFHTLSGLQNASAIGAYAQVQASNAIVLGSVDVATKVGIGTTIPLNTFSVSPVDLNSNSITASQSSGSGTITASSAIFSAANVGEEFIWADGTQEMINSFTDTTHVTGSSTVITETTQFFRTHQIGLQVTSTGNVGIGTSSPGSLLTVGANASISSAGLISSTGGTSISGNIDLNNGAFGTSVQIEAGTATGGVTIGNSAAGAISLQSGNSVNITAANNSTITTGATHTLTVTSSNFNVASTGVVTLLGGQTVDVNTASASLANGITLKPGDSTAAVGNTAAALSLKAGDQTGSSSGTANGGSLTLQGGSATGTGGTRNGGNVTIDAGTGATANGAVNIGTTNAASLTFGNTANTATVAVKTKGTSTTAFTVQNASSAAALTVDTSNMRLGVDVTYASMSVPSISGTSTATTGGTLAQNTTYFYEITAVDANGGETTPSTQASQLTGNTTSTNTITLTWAPITGAAGYHIYRSTTSGNFTGVGYYSTLGTVSGGNLTFVDTNATLNNTSATPPGSNTAYVASNVSNTNNLELSVGGNGTATGQVYISGTVPSGAMGSASTGGSPAGVYTQGSYSYVIRGGVLEIFDISNPAAPVQVGSVSTGVTMVGLYVQGHYAYATGSATLFIFDISKPSAPTTTASLTVNKGTIIGQSGIYVSGRYAYVTDSNSNAMQIFDVFNPAAPVAVSSVATGTTPNSVYVSGRYAYVTNSGGATLQVFDVSNPASPTSVGTVSTGSTPCSVYVQGRYAYVVNANGPSLQIFDVSNPASPVSVGTITTGTTPQTVVVQGRYAYLTNGSASGLQIINVSNPAAPVSVGSTTTGSTPGPLFVQGRYAYIGTASQLQIFDLGGTYSQQLQAGSTETGTLQVDTNAIISGDQAVVGALNVGQSVQANGNLGVGGNAFVQGSLAIVGGVQGGVTINGLSTPSAPTVTFNGTTGTTATWSYQVVAVSASGGTTPASATGSISASDNATLSAGNLNVISWAPVSGAVAYNIYRTAVGTSPTTTGLIGTTTSTAFDDTGVAGNSATASALDSSGQLTVNGFATFKNTTNSTTAFQVQNSAGTAVLTADTSANQVLFGTVGSLVGKLVVASATAGGSVTVTAGSLASNITLTLPTALASSNNQCLIGSTGGVLSFANCNNPGASTKTINLTPEYAGAALDSASDTGGTVNCNTNNSGTMTSGWDNTQKTNYYQWTSSQASEQCYDIIVQIPVPNDWAAWSSTTPILVQMNASSTTNTHYAFQVLNTSGTAETSTTYGSQGTFGATGWAGISPVTLSSTTTGYSAGGVMTLKIRVQAKSSATVQVGNITLNYQ